MSPTFAPIGGGGVPKATVNATSGSPTTNNNARAGKTIYEFNGSGSITVGTAGTAEIFVLGGGGAGGGTSTADTAGGGGGAAALEKIDAFLSSGNLSIVVGAGGNTGVGFNFSTGRTLSGSTGYPSRIADYIGIGGGGGAGSTAAVPLGFATTTGGGKNARSSVLLTNLGYGGVYNGALGIDLGTNSGAGGGGAGAGGNGNAGSNGGGGNGGNGASTNITGSSLTYGGGGGGEASGTNSANTPGSGGSGGGGAVATAGTANLGAGGGARAAGGSGKVIVVIG